MTSPQDSNISRTSIDCSHQTPNRYSFGSGSNSNETNHPDLSDPPDPEEVDLEGVVDSKLAANDLNQSQETVSTDRNSSRSSNTCTRLNAKWKEECAATAPNPSIVGMTSDLEEKGIHPTHTSCPPSFAQSNALNHNIHAGESADPLLLRSKIVDPSHVLRRRPRHSRKVTKGIKEYYEQQNILIENLLKPIEKHVSDEEEEMERASRMVNILIYANIVANFALAALQLYAALSSLSLSLFATAADSVFDPIANVVLNRIHQKSTNLDKHKWPVGGSRLENAANCVYAFLMASVSLILIVESARDIGSHESTDIETLHIPALIAVGVAFVTKAVLGILNYKFRAFSSQLDMLWEDCRNDLVINGFGLITCATGAKVVWWLDPAGAMIISVGVIIAWGSTAYHQFEELCGITAPPEFIKLAAYNALHLHYHDIVSLESIVAYHSGPKYICEIDIVMRPETSLWKAHDVSQDLQDKIELLPMVERAYIHVDVDVSHKPEHSRKVK